uniref:Uncharacterized protein n=1 Tax=Caenorhabditis japonica TaxID=281687 RepID=A0A8R1ID73_CAEJA
MPTPVASDPIVIPDGVVDGAVKLYHHVLAVYTSRIFCDEKCHPFGSYYVFTNEVCKRRSDVPQFITEVSQRILRNSGKIAEHRSVVCEPRS